VTCRRYPDVLNSTPSAGTHPRVCAWLQMMAEAEAPRRAAQCIAVVVSLCQPLALLYQKVQLPPMHWMCAFLLVSRCCLHQHLPLGSCQDESTKQCLGRRSSVRSTQAPIADATDW
jgi:hypothetical protein